MTWTTDTLLAALHQSALADDTTISLMDGAEPSIALTMHSQGDLAMQITVAGGQLLVSTPLWEVSQLKDPIRFNEQALKLNPVNPLSSIGLINIGLGHDLYIMFGQLSAGSALDQVIEEIEILAENTIEAAELFAAELR